jgi:hypothetical protein
MNPLFKLAQELCPEGTEDDHPFPNHSDSDIWCNGFVTAAELMLSAWYVEDTDVTRRLLAEKLKRAHKN